MAKSDPQSQRKRTWGEALFGDEEGAAAKAQYKREMGINPSYKTKQNVEASISAKAMDNPTSRPVRTEPSSGSSPVEIIGAPGKGSKPRGTAETYTKSYDVKRGASGTYTKSYDVKPKVSVPAVVKKASDKSTQANKAKPSSTTGTPAKPMTNFERMKARQYEKEGYGGRSMTAAGAKAQVQKERSYKNPLSGLASMAKAKMASKVAPKAVTRSVKASGTKQGSTSAFAMQMQGQKVKGSQTYSGAKPKSGFKFSDIFNRKK